MIEMYIDEGNVYRNVIKNILIDNPNENMKKLEREMMKYLNDDYKLAYVEVSPPDHVAATRNAPQVVTVLLCQYQGSLSPVSTVTIRIAKDTKYGRGMMVKIDNNITGEMELLDIL